MSDNSFQVFPSTPAQALALEYVKLNATADMSVEEIAKLYHNASVEFKAALNLLRSNDKRTRPFI